MTVTARSLRIFPVIRSAHIDELNSSTPRPTYYFKVNYDIAGHTVPTDWHQHSLVRMLRSLWTDPPSSLEMFEPMWAQFLWQWVAIALVYRLRTRKTHATLGFYAIENSELEDIAPGPVWLRWMTTPLFRLVLRLILSTLVDRIVFGTDGAAAAYSSLVGRRVETTVIHDLRRPRLAPCATKVRGSAVFVGDLGVRKGLPELMKAWPAVEAVNSEARLEIIGDGALRGEAMAWASERPASREFRGRVPHDEVLRVLSESEVFILPSQRIQGWREQVGLGIIEALSRGCTVISTDETGVAAWLSAHGHHVIPVDETALHLDAVIADALNSPISPAVVLSSLPEHDGRVEADAWLHQPS